MSELFEDVQKHVEHLVSELEGGADYMPTMLARDHEGKVLVVGIMLPDDAKGKDMAAASMAAVCILYRATEAAFTSVAWRVTSRDGKMPELPPSECPDREEVVMVGGDLLIHPGGQLRRDGLAHLDAHLHRIYEPAGEPSALRTVFPQPNTSLVVLADQRCEQRCPVTVGAHRVDREPKVLQMLTETYIKQKELAEEAAAKEAKAREN